MRLCAIAMMASVLCGCQGQRGPIAPTQTQQERMMQRLGRLPTVKSTVPWELPEFIKDRTGCHLKIATNHYEIHTTLSDPLILRKVPVFLETAFLSYADVIGRTIDVPKKLQVYFFETRSQWEDFTRYWTGPLAEAYLKIQSGAYYANGACVTYSIARQANFSILAHEGWHQFSEELFKYRLPAWLDEGLATNFEAYQDKDGRVEFNPHYNGSRLFALRQAIANGSMFTISDLLALDAGQVVSRSAHNATDSQSDPKVSAYYAQLYALVRFLREDNYGQRLSDFQTMLNDAYLGRWPIDPDLQAEAVQRDHNPTRHWNGIVGRIIFGEYITATPIEIEGQYVNFCQKVQSSLRFKKMH